MKKRGLGKGLEALLGNEAIAATENNSGKLAAKLMSLTQLSRNPYQPRQTFDEVAIEALADSIRQHGVIQPLAVRAISNGYEIIAGERRFRAAQLVGLERVPVVVHVVNDADSAIFALIENMQREDLNVIEKAKGIASLIGNFNLTHEACGEVLGQSRSSISNTLRLLELSEEIQEAVIDRVIDMGHARALLAVDKSTQHELLQQIRLQGLTVRETEVLVRGVQSELPTTQRTKKKPEVKQLEARLSEFLQTKVHISQDTSGNGKITLSFIDEDMLKKLTNKLGSD